MKFPVPPTLLALITCEDPTWRETFDAFFFTATRGLAGAANAGSLPPSGTYRPLPTIPFEDVKAADEAAKSAVMARPIKEVSAGKVRR